MSSLNDTKTYTAKGRRLIAPNHKCTLPCYQHNCPYFLLHDKKCGGYCSRNHVFYVKSSPSTQLLCLPIFYFVFVSYGSFWASSITSHPKKVSLHGIALGCLGSFSKKDEKQKNNRLVIFCLPCKTLKIDNSPRYAPISCRIFFVGLYRSPTYLGDGCIQGNRFPRALVTNAYSAHASRPRKMSPYCLCYQGCCLFQGNHCAVWDLGSSEEMFRQYRPMSFWLLIAHLRFDSALASHSII